MPKDVVTLLIDNHLICMGISWISLSLISGCSAHLPHVVVGPLKYRSGECRRRMRRQGRRPSRHEESRRGYADCSLSPGTSPSRNTASSHDPGPGKQPNPHSFSRHIDTLWDKHQVSSDSILQRLLAGPDRKKSRCYARLSLARTREQPLGFTELLQEAQP